MTGPGKVARQWAGRTWAGTGFFPVSGGRPARGGPRSPCRLAPTQLAGVRRSAVDQRPSSSWPAATRPQASRQAPKKIITRSRLLRSRSRNSIRPPAHGAPRPDGQSGAVLEVTGARPTAIPRHGHLNSHGRNRVAKQSAVPPKHAGSKEKRPPSSPLRQLKRRHRPTGRHHHGLGRQVPPTATTGGTVTVHPRGPHNGRATPNTVGPKPTPPSPTMEPPGRRHAPRCPVRTSRAHSWSVARGRRRAVWPTSSFGTDGRLLSRLPSSAERTRLFPRQDPTHQSFSQGGRTEKSGTQPDLRGASTGSFEQRRRGMDLWWRRWGILRHGPQTSCRARSTRAAGRPGACVGQWRVDRRRQGADGRGDVLCSVSKRAAKACGCFGPNG